MRQTHHLSSCQVADSSAPDVCKQQHATCVALFDSVCAPSLSTHACFARFQKRRTAHHPNPTQLVNAHVCSSRVARSHCRLTDPSSPVCELDASHCFVCMRERSFCWNGCVMDVCPARKHLPVALAWETRAALSHAASSRPRTRVDRLERMSFSVAISRWAGVRVTMLRGRARSWARLAHQQPLFMQLQWRHGAGVMACSEQSVCWLRVHERVSKGGERRKKN